MAELKAAGRQKEIQKELKRLKNLKRTAIPRQLAYVEVTLVVGAVEGLIALLLVVFGHLHPQVAAAGVDHHVELTLIVPVHLRGSGC